MRETVVPQRLRLLLALLPLAACAHMQPLTNDKTVCPEYRSLTCASAPECSMDSARGCRVCQCSRSHADQYGTLPTGVPPDRR